LEPAKQQPEKDHHQQNGDGPEELDDDAADPADRAVRCESPDAEEQAEYHGRDNGRGRCLEGVHQPRKNGELPHIGGQERCP
jgi:hypothetical protein